jgi:hypothetical protein
MASGGGTVGFSPFVLFTQRGVRWEEEEEDGGARVEMGEARVSGKE